MNDEREPPLDASEGEAGEARGYSSHEDDSNYQTGYRRPPLETRFKKGQSGNPNGRPKGSVNHSTLFQRMANELIPVKEGEKTTYLSRVQVIFHQVLNKAATGKDKAAQVYLQFAKAYQPPEEEDSEPDLREEDKRMMENHLKRQKRMEAKPVPPPPTDPETNEDK